MTIGRDNEAAAEGVYDRPEARVKALIDFPELGMGRPDIAPGARVLVERPYLILYRVIPQGVQIVRVLHGARSLDETLFNEGLE
jgi:toxin ParE1/3/4